MIDYVLSAHRCRVVLVRVAMHREKTIHLHDLPPVHVTSDASTKRSSSSRRIFKVSVIYVFNNSAWPSKELYENVNAPRKEKDFPHSWSMFYPYTSTRLDFFLHTLILECSAGGLAAHAAPCLSIDQGPTPA